MYEVIYKTPMMQCVQVLAKWRPRLTLVAREIKTVLISQLWKRFVRITAQLKRLMLF